MTEQLPTSAHKPNFEIVSGKAEFSKLYAEGDFEPIALEDIPGELQKEILKRVNRYSLDPENLTKHVSYFKVEQKDGSRVFGARYDNEYTDLKGFDENDKEVWGLKFSEPTFYIFEVDANGKDTGRGGVRLLHDRNIPVVDYTESYVPKTGAGTKRYYLMSALSRFFFKENLHSSNAIVPEATRIWERLTAEGKAEIVETHEDKKTGEKSHRYRLLFPV